MAQTGGRQDGQEAVLPAEVRQLLSGSSLADKIGEAMILTTVSEDGWPHTAMLSVGEVVSCDSRTVRLGLWPGTVTSGNMTRTGKALLVVVYRGKVSYIKLKVKPLPDLQESVHPRKRYEAEVVQVKQDSAKYAEIISGIQIALHDPADVLNRWEITASELFKN
ncbi:hypothetical protein AWM70_20770 [Paenibacillus yonginensis]|uniref:Pyridoxamine 5'-phosphate oxidase putative domain-containing protein n=1 Tax=Paenibacillus yonginensis TaxID=1462996 RepID=A0A1B1N5I9_9BACL|nr:pyridoxamine 5'-phosphate oxidase family protein [Paenibacillus yonginensis]ANS76711.1 hypothetical protein AWM70_20770 [Paenibacillus yonginensis]